MRDATVEALFERLTDTMSYQGQTSDLALEKRRVRRKANSTAYQYRVPQLDSRWLHPAQAAAAFRIALRLFGEPEQPKHTTLHDREVRIRKDRACVDCGALARAGERMLYRALVANGELMSEYRCVYDCRGSHAKGVGGI